MVYCDGYYYGIWLVPCDIEKYKKILSTDHLPHVTLICNILTKERALRMYNMLKEYTREYVGMKINETPLDLNHITYKDSHIMPVMSRDTTTHIHDKNWNKNFYSWGYAVETIDYSFSNYIYWIKHIQLEFNISGSISKELHTSIQYTNSTDDIMMKPLEKEEEVLFKMVVANINDSNPENWYIINNTDL